MDALQANNAHTLVITLTLPFLQFPLIPGMLQVDFLFVGFLGSSHQYLK